jgi:uroporphyrinogen decarboxylase
MNHWDRLQAAIRGEATDRAPVSLWRHWPEIDQDPNTLARAMVEWQRAYDFDLVKYMPTGTYSIEDWGARTLYEPVRIGTRTVTRFGVTDVEQWPRLERLEATTGYMAWQNESLRMAAQALGGTVPILQTVFSPLTTARKLAGDVVFEHMRARPELLEAGLAIIAQTTAAFAQEAMRAGAAGLFFATQCSTTDVMTEVEYRRFGQPFDLQVLDAVKDSARFSLMHVHGENIMFDLMAAYPVNMMNWHDRRTSPNLREAMGRFSGLLVGGVDEWGTLAQGPEDAMAAEVAQALEQTSGKRLMIAPGCVCPIDTPEAHLRAAVKAVRG